jgi:hypothetical protein
MATAEGADGDRAKAVRTLRAALAWKLAPARWNLVAELLDLLAEAAQAGDGALLAAAAAELDQVGPVRITRIGSTPKQPAPEPVRERLNHLVHRLSGPADGQSADFDQATDAARSADRGRGADGPAR